MVYKNTNLKRFRFYLVSKTMLLALLLGFATCIHAQTIGGVSPSDDFDGDGVINSQDLDDDNDGILDTVENSASTIILSGFELLYSVDGSGNLSVGSRAIVRNTITSSGILYHAIVEITGTGGLAPNGTVGITNTKYIALRDVIPANNSYYTYTLKFVPSVGFIDADYQNSNPIIGSTIPKVIVILGDIDGASNYAEITGYKSSDGISQNPVVGSLLKHITIADSPIYGGFEFGTSGLGGPGAKAYNYYRPAGATSTNGGSAAMPADQTNWVTILYDSFTTGEYVFGNSGKGTSLRGEGGPTMFLGNADSSDLDGDGFENQFDLDSDGDGYSDSNEAYANNTISGPDQQYGMTNGMLAVTDSFTGTVATSNYLIVDYTPALVPFKVNIPLNQVSVIGNSANATFTVTIDGISFTVIYKWQVNKNTVLTKNAAINKNAAETWADIINGGIYSGADTATLTLTGITPDMDGYEYRLVIDDTNGKTITSAKTKLSLSSLGIKENEIAGLSIYPNPVTKGILYITSNNSSEKIVTVFDVLGKQILNTKTSNNEVNVANLKSGIYIVKIVEDGKTDTQKIIIE